MEPFGLRYDFSKPATQQTLPAILNEISGQTVIDDSTIACIQDENGIIFLYDTKQNSIRRQIPFAGDGDYEGICCVHEDLYVLRSDGLLYRVVDYASASPRTEEFKTGIPADNNEGLCYDSLDNRLLIACKSKVNAQERDNDLRAVYAFDLASKKLSAEPAYEFYVTDALEFAAASEIALPQKKKKKKKDNAPRPYLKFRMSAIAVHPQTRDLYVLSATDHVLFIYAHTPQETGAGDLRHIVWLPEALFNKPEGICFYPNGDVLITNEAQKKKPTLLQFTYTN